MNPEITPLTVTQLNRQVKTWLEQDVGEIRVLGELSNLSKPASGHLYFTLKDEGAQLRCVYFRNHHHINTKSFNDGQQVIAKGKLSLYEARGDYQLIVQHLQQTGVGELYLQFERLKAKLAQQGLFDPQRKKPIPRFPQTIGVVTSSNAAALKDILTTLSRRFPIAKVRIYPSEVQGKAAAAQLINAITAANQDNDCDVLILARGGGSIEDLWPFNDEKLAITISQSTIPIVSGVGHETDFTIADFVADLRAATPTAAAEAVTPHQFDVQKLFADYAKRIELAIAKILQLRRLTLSHAQAKLASPEQIISKHWQGLDYLDRRLHEQVTTKMQQRFHQLELIISQLESQHPNTILQKAKAKLTELVQQLTYAITHNLDHKKYIFSHLITKLETISPLATLQRGYALATFEEKILMRSDQVNQGDIIEVRLAKGKLSCEVLLTTF